MEHLRLVARSGAYPGEGVRSVAIEAGAAGWLSMEQFQLIAVAPVEQKQALLDTMVQAVATLRVFSGLTLLQALALAGLGPLASAYRSRTLIPRQVIAIVTSMVFASIVVGLATSYLVPFTFQVS